MRSLLLLIALSLFSLTSFAQKDFYSTRWSSVYRYEVQQLPKSALAVVDSIYRKAKKENNFTQATRALIYQSKFGITLEENSELKVIQRFKKEISESKAPMRNILEAFTAAIYWQYFQINRHKFYGRTRTSEKIDSTDFRTWDLATLFREIESHHSRSLQNIVILKQTKLAPFDDLLIRANNSRRFRPTLFDLLAHHALVFYKTNESAIAKPVDGFKVDDEKYVLDFENLTLPRHDTSSGQFRALIIYQQLLAFHKRDRDPATYIDVELERLDYIIEVGSFENKFELQKKALTTLQTRYRDLPISTNIDFELATLLRDRARDNENISMKEAVEVCQYAIQRFPMSDGAWRCNILLESILDPSLSLRLEDYIPSAKPSRFFVQYKNIDSVQLRVYRITPDQEKKFNGIDKDEDRVAFMDSLKAVQEWIVQLKNAGDYKLHSTEVLTPAFDRGTYLARANIADGNHARKTRMLIYNTFVVTDLVLIQTTFDLEERFQVVNRTTGAPIIGADIYLKTRHFTSRSDMIDTHIITGTNGFAILNKKGKDWYNVDITVTYRGDSLALNKSFIGGDEEQDDEDDDNDITARSFVFTDRSIYRPGQTVYFKGIFVQTKARKTSIVAGEYVDVSMEDVNGQEIEKRRLKTNSFGSFHGEFKLPSSGLTGSYSITVDEDSIGDSKFYDDLDDFNITNYNFSVEEYKRPTFEVTFDPVKAMYTLNDSVKAEGVAKAFNGSMISKANFTYRVRRKVVYPYYGYSSWYRPRYGNDQEITDGAGVTDEKGKFVINFPAIPDDGVKKEESPVFHYQVDVDVTDITGETRSSTTTIKVGYEMITATIDVPQFVSKKIKRHKISFKTENLNGQFVPAKGTIEIFKLLSSDQPVRQRPWNSPDLPLLSEEEFKKLFPNDVYESHQRSPQRKEKSVFKTNLDTNASASFNLNVEKWLTGEYLIELRAIDPRGQEALKQQTFKLIDPSRLAVPNNELFVASTDKTEYLVGEMAKLMIGSASPDITVMIDVEKDGKFVKTYVEKLSNNTRQILIPVTKLKESGFSIHYTVVNFNSVMQGTLNLQVSTPTATLDIETQTFRDKIEPGVDERWSFVIKGKDSEQKEAELLASMYDASLDQFKPHSWEFDPNPTSMHYSYNRSAVQDCFGTSHFQSRDFSPQSFHIPSQQYDRLDLFGLSLTGSNYVRVQYLERLYTLRDTVSIVKMRNDPSRQAGYIYGVVVDKDGNPIHGVNVLIKGTTTGTITGLDGSYALDAKKGDVLVFSFIGYNTIESAVQRNNVINVELGEDVSQLEEVIVVGYGTEIKKSYLSAAISIKSENIAPATEYELYRMSLQDKVAGVMVTGAPGGDARIMIRGTSTLNGNAKLPLYVVDGVIVDAAKIDQADLGEIVVLKDADATALYGARGANGVIIVSTKSGQKKIEADLAKVKARTNLKETAFFFPELRTDANGKVRFSFKTPESLTRWKLQLLAHRRDLVFASKTLQTVTQKEFMVSPVAPRFLRTGDQIVFPAKIANLSSRAQEGFISLQITDAFTGKSLDGEFKNQLKNQSFKVGPKTNQEVMWKLRVPDDVQAIQYKVVASSGKYSDGEQNVIPVLQNRMLVTETLPMNIRSGQTKTFTLDKLKTTTSTTLKHHQVTLEVTSNPVWYAIQSLPYLMEYPHECAEQMFSRYYANTLASHLLNSTPRIKQVFDQWNSAGQLISALEKNPELKSIVIQETPWLRDAQSETEQKKRIALLFDLNLMRDQQKEALNKLEAMQMTDGGFPWFKGANEASPYITQHVVSGYGHLKHLNALPANEKNEMMRRAVGYLDSYIINTYERMMRNLEREELLLPNDRRAAYREQYLENYQPGDFVIQFLYMRTFYPEIPPSEKLGGVISYYRGQSGKHWIDYKMYHKGLIALIHQRAKESDVARAIIASLKEQSITSEELGMYWKGNVSGWGWYDAPVETQALMIEAFAEVEGANEKLTDIERRKTLDELRIWLLKNKQTTRWKTTKATTEAIYALLINGTDWLPEKSVEVVVGGETLAVDQSSPEAGTGYFKKTWKGNEVQSRLAEVKLIKKDEGIAWAGLYWQYFEDLDKITPANTPLMLSKKVFIVRNTPTGEMLEPITSASPVRVGDLLRVRIELKVDRDMEFLHMKDMRASGLEPINVMSQYKWRDGLGYYESTKDASTNFFFDIVRKGVYVFEYDLRATTRGDFSNGITTIESMYAPEFGAHSEGIRITIEP